MMLLEKLSKASCPPMCEESFAVTMPSGRCETRKLYVTKHPVHAPEIFEMTNFSKILTLVRGPAL